jgi:hypothetical protein
VRARLSVATANMAQSGVKSAFTPEDAKLGIVGMTKKVYRTEGGLRGLYRGCWATALGVAPYGESSWERCRRAGAGWSGSRSWKRSMFKACRARRGARDYTQTCSPY